jgi:hypothetical protein
MTAKKIQEKIMAEFAGSGAQPGDSLSPQFMHTLNVSLDREDQERYQEAVTTLFEQGWIDLSGTSLQLTRKGWDQLPKRL